MILSAQEITRRLHSEQAQEKLGITPYAVECQQPASYDLRAADDICLARGTCTLVPSMEWVELPRMLPGRFAAGHRLAGGGYLWVQVLLTRDSAVS